MFCSKLFCGLNISEVETMPPNMLTWVIGMMSIGLLVQVAIMIFFINFIQSDYCRDLVSLAWIILIMNVGYIIYGIVLVSCLLSTLCKNK